MASEPRVLVLRAAGINCDQETAEAVALAGGDPQRVHVQRLADGDVSLRDFAALIIPGGFSYGDHLGAGRLLALDLIHRLGDQIREFVAAGRPVLGICNGFQVLAKAGLIGTAGSDFAQTVTVTTNGSAQYECRWVKLAPVPGNRCVFLDGVAASFSLPVGHGEGRVLAPAADLDRLAAGGQVVLQYVDHEDKPTMAYPANPNASPRSIAALCNAAGTVLGLMPHPDRAFLPTLHPDWLHNKQRTEGDGLIIFRNLVRFARSA
ncbi:MAG: phosphoribosylformylglycinamidine synthase I [Herpetosiphon sp.]